MSGWRAARRAIAGAIVVGLAVVGLWQAGVLFEGEDATTESLTVLPPDTAILTPSADEREVGLREGTLAPDFEFSAYDGSRQKLSDYRGQAVYLNFWATWCLPCRVELVDMETALHRYAGEGFAVLAVNNGESFRRGEGYIREIGVELTAFAYDPGSLLFRRYGVQGMPTSFFIDRDGVITRVVQGQVSLRSMQSNIEEALRGYNQPE